jgi:4-hydroxy-tetrahydrodipicolinate reductase
MPGKLAIVGMGKMGHAIADLAPARDWTVVATLDEPETAAGITRQAPEAAPANIRALLAAGCPVVVGTTGWDAHRDDIAAAVAAREGALLVASNFSLGVAVFEQVVARAAALFAQTGAFDAHMIEMHHSAKKDAPSGTALTLARAAEPGWGRPIPITSVRTGAIPGTHEILFDAPFETIRLAHVARDRRVFAEGALVAARWLVGRRGVFTMKDVIADPSP